jgi:hypothetical protein
MRIRLIRKLAENIDGVDLSAHATGDFLDLPDLDAQLLLAEGWAEPAPSNIRVGTFRRRKSDALVADERAEAADRRALPTLDKIRHFQQRFELRWPASTERRRAEDSIREELRDARARTISKAIT